MIHPEGKDYSLVDLNRTGIPLLEIVTEPDISSPDEAYDYLTRLKSILEYLRVSDCDMEKGSLRCDANISVRVRGEKNLGTKVELKNMNTFKGVRVALEYEAKRQASAVEDGEKIVQETRLWDGARNTTVSMRMKEEAKDYRYFPEPDLVPFVADKSVVEKARASLPELPEARTKRFSAEFGLSEYDAGVLASQIDIAEYFEECLKHHKNAKAVANWIMGDILAEANANNKGIRQLGVSPEGLAGLLKMIDDQTISGKMAKDVLYEAIRSGRDPREIVKAKGLSQITDVSELEGVVKLVLEREDKSVRDYRAGKKNALGFLVGQIMKETKGKANPAIVNELLKKRLGE